jgi:hypothetical protein
MKEMLKVFEKESFQDLGKEKKKRLLLVHLQIKEFNHSEFSR